MDKTISLDGKVMEMIPILDMASAPGSVQGQNSGPAGKNLSDMEPNGEKFDSVLSQNARSDAGPQSLNRVDRQAQGDRDQAPSSLGQHGVKDEAVEKGAAGIKLPRKNQADISALMIFLGILNQNAMNNINSMDTGQTSDSLSEADMLLSRLLGDSGKGSGDAVEKLLAKIRKLISGNPEGVASQDIQKEFDTLFSALMDSGNAITPAAMDGIVTKTDSPAEPVVIKQDNQQATGINLLSSENTGTEVEHTGNGLLTEQTRSAGTAPASQASGQVIGTDEPSGQKGHTEKFMSAQQMADSAELHKDNNKVMAENSAEASIQRGKTDSDSVGIKSTHDIKSGENEKNGSLISAMEASPRHSRENSTSRSDGIRQGIRQQADTTQSISSSDTDSSGNEAAGRQHKNQTFVMDFRPGMNHDPAHTSPITQTSQEHTEQTVFQVTAADSTSARAASVSADSVKGAALSDQVRSGALNQISHGLNTAVAMNRNRAVIHLNPPELGSVTIRLHVDHNNNVHASFIAEHAHTHQLIESGMESLKTQLSQNGFDLGQVNVNLTGGGMQDSGTSHREEAGADGKGFENIITDEESDTVVNTSVSGRGTLGNGNGVHIIM